MMTPTSFMELIWSSTVPPSMYENSTGCQDRENFIVLHLPTLMSHVASLRQFAQIRLNFQTVLESTDRKKELRVNSVEEYTYVIGNLRYSVDKPDEAKWSQMTSLWNTRWQLDILRNCVTDSNFLDSPWQIRSQPHASCGLYTHKHLIQQQLMTHTIKSLWKIRLDGLNSARKMHTPIGSIS
jgi:hypothetical protein